jgi:tetratricopeptide (TPR) repeat protein
MSIWEKLRNKYKETPTLREGVKLIPYAGGPVDALVAPDDALRYFIPVNKSFLNKQKERKVESILNASIGDWPLVVQNLDLKRDIQDEIIPILMESSDHPGLLVILGEPGAGKTTLLRRIGKVLTDTGKAVFELRAGARSTPDWLNYLNELPRKKGLPFILVDDIFRYEDIEDILLDADLGCIIIATSRINEDKTNRLRTTNTLDLLKIKNVTCSRTGWPILNSPSERELSELKNKSEFSHIDSKKWHAITTMRRGGEIVASPMLVVMLQLSSDGKPFEEIITDSMTKLAQKHPDTYKAFCILCAFHRFGIPLPATIFEILMQKSSVFMKVLRSEIIKGISFCGANGLIHLGEFFLYEECWQTTHELIAETAANLEYSAHIEEYYHEIMEIIDPAVKEHQVFASIYFRSLTQRNWKHLAKQYLEKHTSLIDKLVLSDVQQQIDWAIAFDKIGENNRALECIKTAVPVTPMRANTLINLLLKYKQLDLAKERAVLWLLDHPDDTSVRTRYIGLVEQKGTPDQVEKVLSETSEWLSSHPDDTFVRTRYIGLVEQKGTPDQVEKVLSKTSVWLASHPDDTSVRTRYIGLVEQKGTPDQVEKVLSETSEWLSSHPDDTSVRTRHIGLVEQKGTPDQVEKVLSETSEWLSSHPEECVIRAKHLTLVAKKGSETEIAEAIEHVRIWLLERSQSTAIQIVFVAFFRIAKKYLELDDLAECFETLIKNSKDQPIRLAYAKWLIGKGELEAAKKEYISLMKDAPNHVDAHHGYARVLLNTGEYPESAEYFRKAISIYTGNQMAHEGLAKSYQCIGGRFEEDGDIEEARQFYLKAEDGFRQAIKLAESKKQPPARFYTSIGWFYLGRNRKKSALLSFEKAMELNPRFFGNYWGIAIIQIENKEFKSAKGNLEIAIKNLPSRMGPPASEEIPELLKKCMSELNLTRQ